jgi:hypothetical protein
MPAEHAPPSQDPESFPVVYLDIEINYFASATCLHSVHGSVVRGGLDLEAEKQKYNQLRDVIGPAIYDMQSECQQLWDAKSMNMCQSYQPELAMKTKTGITTYDAIATEQQRTGMACFTAVDGEKNRPLLPVTMTLKNRGTGVVHDVLTDMKDILNATERKLFYPLEMLKQVLPALTEEANKHLIELPDGTYLDQFKCLEYPRGTLNKFQEALGSETETVIGRFYSPAAMPLPAVHEYKVWKNDRQRSVKKAEKGVASVIGNGYREAGPLINLFNPRYQKHYWVEPLHFNAFGRGAVPAEFQEQIEFNPLILETLMEALVKCDNTIFKHPSNVSQGGAAGSVFKTLRVSVTVHILPWETGMMLVSEDDHGDTTERALRRLRTGLIRNAVLKEESIAKGIPYSSPKKYQSPPAGGTRR